MEEKNEIAGYWQQQRELPWRRRDRLWWAAVVLPAVLIAVAWTVFLVRAALNLLG